MIDVLIVGAGPAGCAAAVYLKRYGFNVKVIEKSIVGGNVVFTNKVDNYLGIFDETGLNLSTKFKEHLKFLDIEIINDQVLSIEKKDNFILKLKNSTLESKYLILASGRTFKRLGLENEEKYVGRGISFCAICDGPMTKNKNIVVVGGGNSAFEETLHLAKYAKEITILVRDEIRADKYLVDKVKSLDNVTISLKEEILEYKGDMYLTSIVTNKREINVDAVFLYVGLVPQIDYLKDLNLNIKNNYIIVDKNYKTNIDRCYAVGDVIDKRMYQIATSVAEGVEAAFSINEDNI
mgnify:FL=1|jgi:thioredoxin-disulfide reductase